MHLFIMCERIFGTCDVIIFADEVLELGSEEDLARTVQECIKELTRLDNLGKSMPVSRSHTANRTLNKEEDANGLSLLKGLQQAGWVVCALHGLTTRLA